MALSKFKPASFDLTDNYAFTGTTTGVTDTNQLVLIKTLTASSSGTLSFVNGASSVVLDNTYKTYLFKFINIHASGDEVDLQVGFRDGGSAYDATKTTTYFEAIHDEGDSTAQVSYIDGLDIAQGTGFQTILRYLGNDNDESSSGEMYLFNPSSTTFVKHFMSESITLTTNGYVNHLHVAGYCNVTAAIDAVQFKMSSGNVDSGTIKLYGIL
tara:strand:- start:1007 stop:1642 length:636 start_codon:yes stop_codon:yes gene_type:complete